MDSGARAHRLWYLVSSYTSLYRTHTGHLASLTNIRENKILRQGSFSTHLLILVNLCLGSCNWYTHTCPHAHTHTHKHTHSSTEWAECLCDINNCTGGTCKLNIVRTRCVWWASDLLHLCGTLECLLVFPSNKTGFKGGVCNCSWDHVKTNTAYWYGVMLQEVVRGHNGGRQSGGQVVAGLLEDNRKSLIS